MVFDLSKQLLALMSWVEGPFCAFSTLASKSDFTTTQLNFVSQNWWPLRPLGWYGVNTCPMAAFSGFLDSYRPAVLGNALVTILPDPHGQQNRCIFSMSCINVAKRPWYGQLKIKPSYTIVHYYVFSYFIYYGGPTMALLFIIITMYLVSSYIMLAHRRQSMPFWHSLLTINYVLL